METNLARRAFLGRLGLGTAAIGCPLLIANSASAAGDEALKTANYENQFLNNWLSDLFDAIYAEVDPKTQVKLLEACGRACFRRHAFKQDIAKAGKGDVLNLVEAYQKSFGIEVVGDRVHITYGGGRCYCPAARKRTAHPNDVHCECTRATHQMIWETAMGRPYQIDLVETVRRGGEKCHLVVHLA